LVYGGLYGLFVSLLGLSFSLGAFSVSWGIVLFIVCLRGCIRQGGKKRCFSSSCLLVGSFTDLS